MAEPYILKQTFASQLIGSVQTRRMDLSKAGKFLPAGAVKTEIGVENGKFGLYIDAEGDPEAQEFFLVNGSVVHRPVGSELSKFISTDYPWIDVTVILWIPDGDKSFSVTSWGVYRTQKAFYLSNASVGPHNSTSTSISRMDSFGLPFAGNVKMTPSADGIKMDVNDRWDMNTQRLILGDQVLQSPRPTVLEWNDGALMATVLRNISQRDNIRIYRTLVFGA